MSCDICGFTSDTEVFAGRWIVYCLKHKDIDRQKTFENEINPALESGDFESIDGEIANLLI
jgi:hypothetical protein